MTGTLYKIKDWKSPLKEKKRNASSLEKLNLYSAMVRTINNYYLIIVKVNRNGFLDMGTRTSAIILKRASTLEWCAEDFHHCWFADSM